MSESYRDKFTSSAKPEEYERQFEPCSYGDILWHVEQQQLDEVVKNLRLTHDRIEHLDFACGTGRIISFLESRVDSSVGIEISPSMSELARQKLNKGKVLCADITAPDYPIEGQYDLITAFRFFLNAEPGLRVLAMRALAARLKDESSRIVFNNHGNLWSHKLMAWPFHQVRRMGSGYISEGNYMTLAELAGVADAAGLQIERVMGCGVFSAKSLWVLPFERLLSLEDKLSGTAFARRFGVNQMCIARLK